MRPNGAACFAVMHPHDFIITFRREQSTNKLKVYWVNDAEDFVRSSVEIHPKWPLHFSIPETRRLSQFAVYSTESYTLVELGSTIHACSDDYTKFVCERECRSRMLAAKCNGYASMSYGNAQTLAVIRRGFSADTIRCLRELAANLTKKQRRECIVICSGKYRCHQAQYQIMQFYPHGHFGRKLLRGNRTQNVYGARVLQKRPAEQLVFSESLKFNSFESVLAAIAGSSGIFRL